MTTAPLTPTSAPPLPETVLRYGRPNVLVTGASGELERAVVDELLASHIPARALVHRSAGSTDESVTLVPGNIATGAGLDEALDGVGAVIHCASSPRDPQRVDVGGTRNLVRALDAWAPRAHLVHVSIIGCWENPLPYYRAKADAENVVEAWSGRASIVRATQFHPFARSLVAGRARHVTGAMRSIAMTPVDPDWVARTLVDVALMRTPSPRPLELTGPETFTLHELATLTAHLEGHRAPRAVAVPALGGVMGAFAAGTHLATSEHRVGGRTYAQWLSSTRQR